MLPIYVSSCDPEAVAKQSLSENISNNIRFERRKALRIHIYLATLMTFGALFGVDCRIALGADDTVRQATISGESQSVVVIGRCMIKVGLSTAALGPSLVR